jgi:hypothetical protein
MFYVVYKGSIFHESSGVPRVPLRGHGHGRPKDVSSPKASENEYVFDAMSIHFHINTYQQNWHVLFCTVHHPEPH